MLREVGKIYARAFRMSFQYPIFIYLPAAYYSYCLFYNIAKNYMPLSVLAFWQVIDFAIDSLFTFGVPIVFILIVLRANETIDMKTIISEARGYFWKCIGQSLAGLTLAFLYHLPFLCLVFVIYNMAGRGFIFVYIWFWILGFIGTGSITLGLRFLIDGGKGIFKNSMDGLRMLNGYFLFFITLYGVETIISMSNYVLRLYIGSLFTGLDLSTISFSSMSSFTKSVLAFYQTPAVYVYDVIIGTILFSFYINLITFAYIRCKNHTSLSQAVHQT